MRPDAGRIALEDRVLFDSEGGINLRPERRRIGYVFQDGRLFPHLSVRGNLLYGQRFAPREGRYATLERIVTLLGLEALLRRRPGTLSGGERQRVALGRALMAQPALLLMDEPLAALDVPRKAQVIDYIERLRDEIGVPIVFVSHAVDEVARLAGTIVVHGGRQGRGGRAGRRGHGPARSRPAGRDRGRRRGAGRDRAAPRRGLRAHRAWRSRGASLRVPRLRLEPGRSLRVRVRARDVSLATAKPRETSVLNVFRGTVVEIGARRGASVDVAVDIGARLTARITARSADALGLAPGKEVYALVKSVAVDPASLVQSEQDGA